VIPKPRISIQTAMVVGPSGEEIYTDEHGRVKIPFYWDREGKNDENSSCWIRASQLWAGAGWGAMYIPRIGQEVLVDFIEGDPDEPIIVGRVYNGRNLTPYPGEKTKSTIKSNSSKGGGGSNEFRFEDKKGEEEIYLHGQKDWNIKIENDKSQQIGRDETDTVTNAYTLNAKNATIIATEKILLQVGGSTIEISGNSISIKSSSVSISGGKVSVTASGQHIIKGEPILINC